MPKTTDVALVPVVIPGDDDALRKIKYQVLDKLFAWWGDREPKPSRALGIAGIHATIITILIGVTSAYYIFTQDKIHEIEMQTIREAEKINQVKFAPSFYKPSRDDFSKYNEPKNIEQTINLLPFLYVLLSEANNLPGMEIPKTPADRAERALQIMSLLVHRYPFPESISEGSSFPPKPLQFRDKVVIAKWSYDLENLIRSMRLFIYMTPMFIGERMNEYFQALYIRDKELHERWKTNLGLQAVGYVDPYFLFNDYIRNLQRADEINRSVRFYLDKVELLERRFVTKKQMLVVIGFTFLAFFCGVVLPLFTGRVRRVFLLWIPCGFYIFAFSFLVYRLIV
jgi:hypothetical protein